MLPSRSSGPRERRCRSSSRTPFSTPVWQEKGRELSRRYECHLFDEAICSGERCAYFLHSQDFCCYCVGGGDSRTHAFSRALSLSLACSLSLFLALSLSLTPLSLSLFLSLSPLSPFLQLSLSFPLLWSYSLSIFAPVSLYFFLSLRMNFSERSNSY